MSQFDKKAAAAVVTLDGSRTLGAGAGVRGLSEAEVDRHWLDPPWAFSVS